MKQFTQYILIILIFAGIPLHSSETGMAEANGIQIWYETFGKKSDPALLLIMGGCSQGIFWPTEFCERLSNEGFYVIRYDNRDTGVSTYIDYEKQPYGLTEFANDSLGLLDYLKIKQAHVVGLSMGGPIAEIMAVNAPERVLSLTLISTSCDFEPSNSSYEGRPLKENSLPPPKRAYLDWMHQFLTKKAETFDQILDQRVEAWRLLNGNVVPFEEELYRNIIRQVLLTQKSPDGIKNHFMAMKNSEALIREVCLQVAVPTVIIHGTEDLIFPIEHGEALSKAIAKSRYVPLKGFGHVLNKYFYNDFIREIKNISKMRKRK